MLAKRKNERQETSDQFFAEKETKTMKATYHPNPIYKDNNCQKNSMIIEKTNSTPAIAATALAESATTTAKTIIVATMQANLYHTATLKFFGFESNRK